MVLLDLAMRKDLQKTLVLLVLNCIKLGGFDVEVNQDASEVLTAASVDLSDLNQ